ncbi:MAG: cell division protein FtsI/penicillin-binding protein [Desulfobulbaceae bacterium]|nr:MAG: cell division protein FtsI/penicillin-binding protein [Desulfobulbaceae bacterium]
MAIQSRRVIKKSRRGFVVLWMMLIGLVGIVGVAVYYKQEIPGLVQKALSVFSRQDKGAEKKKNGRGTIYDRSFREMALSLDRVSVYVRPRELEDPQLSAERLAIALGMSEQEILDRFDKEVQWVWLAKDISLEEEKAVADLNLRGVSLHREQIRSYPYKKIAAHILGFADHNMGLAGVEQYYNRLLDQTSIGQDDFPQVDLQGHYRTGGHGQHLVLTIDLKIQDFLEKYVAALGAAHEGVQVAAVLMGTETGSIIANAHFPSFDPNVYYQYGNESLANILLEPMVIPRDILRFFQEAALVQTAADCNNQRCPWSIVAGSVDSGNVSRWWEQLALNAQPELDFSAQNNGGETNRNEQPAGAPVGVSGAVPVQASPMQILLGINALVNEGHKVVPHVLERVLERTGDREYAFRDLKAGKMDTANSSLASVETWQLLKARAHTGVLDSALVDVQGLSFQSVLNKGGEYHRNRLLVAIVPGDKPELTLMVLMRQPYLEPSTPSVKGGPGLAGSAEKILPSMMALQQVHKNLSDMMSMSERKESNYQQQQEKKKLAKLETILKEQHPVMPDLSGLSMRKALRLLQDKNVKVRIQGTGRVVGQSPLAGKPLTDVKECRLTLKKDDNIVSKVSAPPKVHTVRDQKVEESRRSEIKK